MVLFFPVLLTIFPSFTVRIISQHFFKKASLPENQRKDNGYSRIHRSATQTKVYYDGNRKGVTIA